MVAAPASDGLVAGIDHLLIDASDADALLALFADTFALPLFPMTVQATFASGGVFVGTYLVEVFRSSARVSGPLPPGVARIRGIALRPAGPLEASLAKLHTRGIAHGVPDSPMPTWTNIDLPGLIPDHAVFLSHPEPENYERRRMWARQLQERDGGPLGIETLHEVVVSVPDIDAAVRRWEPVLAPTQPSGRGCWALPAGPTLRLEAGGEDGMTRIVFRVKDLDRAATFLTQQQLLGEVTAQRVSVNPERVQSLHLAFTAA